MHSKENQNIPTNQVNNTSQTHAWGIVGMGQACPNCQSIFFVCGDVVQSICPLCLKADLEALDPEKLMLDEVQPELMIMYQVDQSRLQTKIVDFSSGIPYAPDDLTPTNLSKRLVPVFLPAWLIDTVVNARWTAEMGFNYEVVSHREQFDQNAQRWLTQEVKETRIGWEQRTGNLEREYPNIGAPAIENEKTIQEELGGYDQNDARQYHPDYLSGGEYIKLPTRLQDDAWNEAAIEVQRQASDECRIAGSADFIRNFKWEPNFIKQNWTLFLRPIYTSYYLDDDHKVQRLWIQGVTGKISGTRKSSLKRAQGRAITILTIAAVIFLLGLVIAGIGLIFPPALLLGGLVLIIASVTGVSALLPIFKSWQFNKAR